MPPPLPHLCWSSDRTLRVAFDGGIDAPTQARVHDALRRLRNAGIADLIDLTPAYATLGVTFDLARLDHAAAERCVREALADAAEESIAASSSTRTVDIPVDYGGIHGPDLADVAQHANLSQSDVAGLHASGAYVVCFLGFAPGFAYLAGLPEALATPRLATPRPRVPAGSVAIAGGQTAVYPGNTPGGWRIVGRARVDVFNPTRGEASLLQAGDRVRFSVASVAPSVIVGGAAP